MAHSNLEHWTRRLPEAGRITSHADDIENCWARIAQHKRAIEELEHLVARYEREAVSAAQYAGWTLKDISAARKQHYGRIMEALTKD